VPGCSIAQIKIKKKKTDFVLMIIPNFYTTCSSAEMLMTSTYVHCNIQYQNQLREVPNEPKNRMIRPCDLN